MRIVTNGAQAFQLPSMAPCYLHSGSAFEVASLAAARSSRSSLMHESKKRRSTISVAQGDRKCANDAQIIPMKITKNGTELLLAPDKRRKIRNSRNDPPVPIMKCEKTVLISVLMATNAPAHHEPLNVALRIFSEVPLGGDAMVHEVSLSVMRRHDSILYKR